MPPSKTPLKVAAPKKNDSKLPKKVEAVEAVEAVAAPVVQSAGGKKVAKVAEVSKVPEVAKVAEVAEVAEVVKVAKVAKVVKGKAEAVAAPVVAKKGGAKTKAVVPAAPEKVAAPQKAAGKKVAVPKAEKAPKAKKEVGEVDEEAEDIKGVRSFKVQLPGTEEYSGRFTGLTPYQAANKALSKYFRENKQAKTEITFSIRESTRGSKRSTYSYNGKREKLEVPVKYSIKSADGEAREIVKEYKNRLTKVKKADVKEAAA